MGAEVKYVFSGGQSIEVNSTRYSEFNDRKPPGANLQIDTKDFTVAGALGAGIDYFVTSNIAVNFEAK